MAIAQLLDHLEVNILHDDIQAAYRQFHSTEIALLRYKNDVLSEMKPFTMESCFKDYMKGLVSRVMYYNG